MTTSADIEAQSASAFKIKPSGRGGCIDVVGVPELPSPPLPKPAMRSCWKIWLGTVAAVLCILVVAGIVIHETTTNDQGLDSRMSENSTNDQGDMTEFSSGAVFDQTAAEDLMLQAKEIMNRSLPAAALPDVAAVVQVARTSSSVGRDPQSVCGIDECSGTNALTGRPRECHRCHSDSECDGDRKCGEGMHTASGGWCTGENNCCGAPVPTFCDSLPMNTISLYCNDEPTQPAWDGGAFRQSYDLLFGTDTSTNYKAAQYCAELCFLWPPSGSSANTCDELLDCHARCGIYLLGGYRCAQEVIARARHEQTYGTWSAGWMGHYPMEEMMKPCTLGHEAMCDTASNEWTSYTGAVYEAFYKICGWDNTWENIWQLIGTVVRELCSYTGCTKRA